MTFVLGACDPITVQSVQITAEDPGGTADVFTTEVTRIEGSNSCEYRLEFKDPGTLVWEIGEVAGDQGPAQRHNPSPCAPASFSETPTSSLRQFEEQTIYYWSKEAREYAVANLWITPPGWTGGTINHAGEMLGPTLLTDGAFNRACLPNARSGCMRVWPHEGPKTHYRAGRVSDDLVAHEYGHYAAGYVFGHMDVVGVDGFDITNCAKRSFQEGIAESFERLFVHHVANLGAAATVPNMSAQDAQWQNRCGTADGVMGAPLWQSVNQATWGENFATPALTVGWTTPQDANRAMVHAFSHALALNRGHRIHRLAYAMLDYIQAQETPAIYNDVLAIFASHGMAPTALGGSCINNDECDSGYCDHGNNTSHTDQCMPGPSAGATGDPCSNDNQCASSFCQGLLQDPSGSWIPGQCADKAALGQACLSNLHCSSGYCDAGWGTSKTDQCMPGAAAGQADDPCSNHNQCESANCEGLTANPDGSWNPGLCAAKLGLAQTCSHNENCASGYCDSGNNTSHTDLCMPAANAGQTGEPCSHDNQCASLYCQGLTASHGAWIPGACAVPGALGQICGANTHCASGYCDAGNNTSHTSLCMPAAGLGVSGDPCSNDNQCASSNCAGLVASAGGSWIPGQCASQGALGQPCNHNDHCVSGYCDHGNGTSHTDQCMPGASAGGTGDPCSNDNQCASTLCAGLAADSAGNWIPGQCAAKLGLAQPCTQNGHCASGYCDTGNFTSHTDQCMPGAGQGSTGQPCSNDNQCVSSNCSGLTQDGYGDWIPGTCDSKLGLGVPCTANHQCASAYCDAGNNTSHTSQCMPGPAAGGTGDPCSNDNQCASSNCAGLVALGGGNWSPGNCAAKRALGQGCMQNYQCASGYCDHGNNTSHTDLCMPGASAGSSGDPCSNHNQCSSGNCVGLTPAADGSWNPGTCS